MRKATIDLDWLDKEISIFKHIYNNTSYENERSLTTYHTYLSALVAVRSNCTPIELPEKCLNNWEDKKFCSNNGKCKMCNQ